MSRLQLFVHHVTGCRLSAMKKQNEQRLDDLEARLGELGSAVAGKQKMTAVADDINASVERRLTQMQDQLRQETADKCLQIEQVRW